MFWKLLAVFILVPALEFALLLEVGNRIGVLGTLLLILLTGFLGSTAAKNQGTAIFQRIRNSLNQGETPAEGLVDSLLVFVAGILLITPGFLTDAVGFALLVPNLRFLAKGWLASWLLNRLGEGKMTIFWPRR